MSSRLEQEGDPAERDRPSRLPRTAAHRRGPVGVGQRNHPVRRDVRPGARRRPPVPGGRARARRPARHQSRHRHHAHCPATVVRWSPKVSTDSAPGWRRTPNAAPRSPSGGRCSTCTRSRRTPLGPTGTRWPATPRCASSTASSRSSSPRCSAPATTTSAPRRRRTRLALSAVFDRTRRTPGRSRPASCSSRTSSRLASTPPAARPREVAAADLRRAARAVPADVAGIAFLSGGHPTRERASSCAS